MKSRHATSRRVFVAFALAGLLSLSGCGSAHPGAAAVVGDTTIRESTLDELADAVCVTNATAARESGQPGPPSATRDLRRLVLDVLIRAELASQAAAEAGVSVTDAEVERQLASGTGLPETLPPAVEEQLTGLLLDLARTRLLTAAIGEQLAADSTGQGGDQQAARAGQNYINEYADEAGVEVDPRFGEYSPQGIRAASGSLSVPVSETAVESGRAELSASWTKQLSASQTC